MDKKTRLIKQSSLEITYQNIRDILEEARRSAYRSVNFEMVQAYWQISRIIVEEEQKGKERAEYGKALITELSRKLTYDYGKGFNERNLWYMRNLYSIFPKVNALRPELRWTHYYCFDKVKN